MEANKTVSIEATTVIHWALVFILVTAFYLLFKGVTNVFNAFFVPLTFFFFAKGQKLEDTILVYGGLFLFIAIFFRLQIFFTLLYFGIAILLTHIPSDKYLSLKSTFLVSVAAGFGLWLAIIFTDDFFLTQVNQTTLAVLNESNFAYVILLWVEGFLISIGLIYFSEKISRFL